VVNSLNSLSQIKIDLRNETYRQAGMWAIMLSNPDQCEHMKFIIRTAGAKRGIEIGTFTGYSALCMAEGLPDDGLLICLEKSETYTELAKDYWDRAGVGHKIQLRIGAALDSLAEMAKDEENLEAFDFAFIDGDKSLYTKYVDNLLPFLKPGGFLMLDNTLWMGKVADPNLRAADLDTRIIYETVTNALTNPRFDMHTLCIADGLTIIQVR